MNKYLAVTLTVMLLSCSDSGVPVSPVPPDISIDELLAVPDTVMVQSTTLTLSTAIWRDFMPFSPPDGKPLIATAYVDAIDTVTFPSSIRADAIWIVYAGEVWKSFFTSEIPPPNPLTPNRLERIARNGPKWGPDVYVDVVVRILDSQGNAHLVRAAHQWIGRTD